MFRSCVFLGLFLTALSPAFGAPLAAITKPGLAILAVKVTADRGEDYAIAVEYIFDGTEPLEIRGHAIGAGGPYSYQSLRAGRNTANITLTRAPSRSYAFETRAVLIEIYRNGRNELVLNHQFDHRHAWPDPTGELSDESVSTPDKHAKLLSTSIALIDSGRDEALTQAEHYLQQILVEDKSMVQAYSELARVRMKQPGPLPEKFKAAEELLNTAYAIDPNHADTLVLRGYVLGVQRRTEEALSDLNKAEKLGTENRWLYYNRGLTLEAAGRDDEAIAAYRAGIAKPLELNAPNSFSNNRAVPGIFKNLGALLERRSDWKALRVLAERNAEIMHDDCQRVNAAGYALAESANYLYAIGIAEKRLGQCGELAHQVLGAGYLLQAQGDMKAPRRTELAEAALRLNVDAAKFLVYLAQYNRTAKTIPPLLARGIEINSDISARCPLALAVQANKYHAVKNLLDLGAYANQLLDDKQSSVLLLAVLRGDVPTITLILKHGADPDIPLASGISVKKLVEEDGNAELKAAIRNNSKPL